MEPHSYTGSENGKAIEAGVVRNGHPEEIYLRFWMANGYYTMIEMTSVEGIAVIEGLARAIQKHYEGLLQLEQDGASTEDSSPGDGRGSSPVA